MATDDEQWWDAQSGEYVLGTLRGIERDVFKKILESDSDVQARVNFWSRALGTLDNYAQTLEPPAHVLRQILNRIETEDDLHDLTSDWNRDLDATLDAHSDHSFTPPDTPPPQHRETRTRRTRNTVWRAIALMSIAASIALAVLLLRQVDDTGGQLLIPNTGSLSIVQGADQRALWLVTLASHSNLANIIALAPPSIAPTQSHQLWMVQPDDRGVSAVGLLPRNTGESRAVELPMPISSAQIFAVSLEPAAGSSQATPSGPLLFSGTIQALGKSRL